MDSGRCWECRWAVILFLRAWDVGGFEGGDKMERYLPVLEGHPSLFVFVVLSERR